MAYNKQLPPDHPRHYLPDPVTGKRCGCSGPHLDWKIWLLMTARGYGKTRTGANWVLERGLAEPGIWIAICAPTFIDVKNVCIEGPSGVLASALPGEVVDYNKNGLKITLRNGSVIQGYTADRVDSIRGANLAYCWFDEAAVIRDESFYHFGLLPALRISKSQLLITTTPRSRKLIRDIKNAAEKNPEGRVHYTNATTFENWKSPSVQEMAEGLGASLEPGSHLYRQEIEGELIGDVPGALFSPLWFEGSRVEFDDLPEFRRTVIAVDPASSATPGKSDETGIVVAAEGVNRELYTLEDCSLTGTPNEVMEKIDEKFNQFDCDLCVAEQNGVKEYFKVMLYNQNPHIPLKLIPAMVSKKIRAQPISPLVEQGRVHMVGFFDKLEEQLCAMTAFDDRVKLNDDRADAWVYAMRELCGFGSVNWKETYGFFPCSSCDEDVQVYKDKVCKHCGTPVTAQPLPQDKTRQKSAIRWSAAYYRTCPEGHEFPLKAGKCPDCNGDPGAYMRQVMKLSGGNSGKLSYTGKNWLGR